MGRLDSIASHHGGLEALQIAKNYNMQRKDEYTLFESFPHVERITLVATCS